MSLAVIPARGGSKRIPRKNVREFCGQPMIAYSIQAALASEVFQRVIVSTDDPEVAQVALKYGAEVPFMRPAHLADDYAITVDVISHAIEELSQDNWICEHVCCIYATAPFIAAQDIRQSFETIRNSAFDYVFPATTFPYSIFRALQQSADGATSMIFPEYVNTRSQDLPEALHDAGQFYWGRSAAWQNRSPILSGNSAALRIPRSRVQDIDTEEDWHYAEILFRMSNEVGS